MSPDLMIDNAAMASQNQTLIDDPVTREAIRLNVIDPLLARIRELEHALNVIDALDPEDHIHGCSEHAARGLVSQMGRTARNVLREGGR